MYHHCVNVPVSLEYSQSGADLQKSAFKMQLIAKIRTAKVMLLGFLSLDLQWFIESITHLKIDRIEYDLYYSRVPNITVALKKGVGGFFS